MTMYIIAVVLTLVSILLTINMIHQNDSIKVLENQVKGLEEENQEMLSYFVLGESIEKGRDELK